MSAFVAEATRAIGSQLVPHFTAISFHQPAAIRLGDPQRISRIPNEEFAKA